jgi:hypothetical protein
MSRASGPYLQLTELRRGYPCAGAPQDRPQTGAQLEIAGRSGDEVVGTGVEGTEHVELVGSVSREDHRHAAIPRSAGGRCGANLLEQRQRATRRVERSEQGDLGDRRRRENASVLGVLCQLDRISVG